MQAGDIGFLGVNNRLAPEQLPAGVVAEAINRRFTKGVAEARKGIRKLNWLNRQVVSGDYRRKLQPFAIIYGVGKYNDPNGFEWDVVAADGAVYFAREQQFPATSVPLPFGVTITSTVTFTQCFNVLLMFRGEDLDELVLDNIEEGFKAIVRLPNEITGTGTENPDDGNEDIPPAERGLFFQNRVWIPYNRDLVGVSDYLNYTRYSPTRSVARINQGSNDALVTLGRFNETTLIAFKEQSIYAMGNLTGDLTAAFLYEITSEYGCKAPRSVVAVGKDLWFLADKRGVCSITLTEQNKIQGVDVPVSQDIQDTIDRINWRYAENAVAKYWQNRLYMAVPIDNAEVVKPNIIPSGAEYDADGVYEVYPVRVGNRYRWTMGANDVAVANGQGLNATYDGAGHYTDVFGPAQAPTGYVPGARYLWNPGTSTSLINGVDTLLAVDGPQIFTAAGTSVTFVGTPGGFLSEDMGEVFRESGGDFTTTTFVLLKLVGTPGEPVTATLQPLFQGVNNAVLVYDFQAGKWSGHDESAVIMVRDWSLTTVKGKQRLVFFSADGTMNLYEEGALDENIYEEALAPIVYENVETSLTTRGYLFETLEPKSALRGLLAMAGLNPTYTIELLTEGVRESVTLVSNRTKNRLKYYRPHDQPDWDPSNVNGDFMRPYREDYAWVMGEDPDATYLDTKILPDTFQEIEEKLWLTGRGKYCQLRITGSVGMLTVFSVNTEAVVASKRFGAHA